MRARKSFLFDQYSKSNHSLDKLVSDVNEAYKLTEEKANNEQDKDKKEMLSKMLQKVKENLEKLGSNREDSNGELKEELLKNSSDILSTWLDKLEGKNVTDNSIFQKLPRHFESEFHRDMAALNVIDNSF